MPSIPTTLSHPSQEEEELVTIQQRLQSGGVGTYPPSGGVGTYPPAAGGVGTYPPSGAVSSASDIVRQSTPIPGLIDMDFKQDYIYFETRLPHEPDTLNFVHKLRQRIIGLMEGTMSPEHASFFLESALPRCVKALLKHKFMDDDIAAEVTKFFQFVMEVIIAHLSSNIVPLFQTLIAIFDNDSYFYFNGGKRAEFTPEDPKDIYAVFSETNNKWCSYYLVDNINYFGSKGGFQHLLSHLKKENPKCPLHITALILELFWTIQHHAYFVAAKQRELITEAQDAVIPLLMGLSNEELKAVKKEDYESVVKFLGRLLDSTMDRRAGSEIMEKLQLDIASKCFKSAYFDKRNFGLTHINEVIVSVRASDREKELETTPNSNGVIICGPMLRDTKFIDPPALVKWLQENKILEHLFRESAQSQFLKRSGEILGFMAKYDGLTPEHLEMIWKCATVHENFHSVILQVIGETCHDLKPSHISQILGHLEATPRKQFSMTYLNLLKDFSRSCGDVNQRLTSMEMLWQILIDVSPTGATIEICAQALLCLQEIVQLYSFKQHRHTWMDKVLDAIKKNISVAFCYELLSTIIFTFPPNKKQAKSEFEMDNLILVIHKLNRQEHLINLFFSELKLFKSQAFSAASLVDTQMYDLNMLNLAGRLEYISEIRVRLKFLHFILTHTSEVLPVSNYDMLWDLLVTNALTTYERDECFSWFIYALREPPDGYTAIDEENAVAIFHQRILKMSPSEQTPLSFACFQRYFAHTNVKKNAMMWKDHKEEDFEVRDKQLSGYDFLWFTILDATHPDVVREATEFIIRLQNKLSARLIASFGKEKLREEFIHLCMEYLKRCEMDYPVDTKVGERRLDRCLSLITTFCSQIEAESGYKLKSHGSSTRGHPVTLHFEINLQNEQPETFQMEFHSNETIEAIKIKIKSKIPKFEGSIGDIFLTTKRKSEEKLQENKTLQELHLADNESIIIQISPSISNDKATVNRSRIKSNQNYRMTPSDSNERAHQLMEMCHVSQRVAIVALRRADWDISVAALQLTDESLKAEITAEAEKSDDIVEKKVVIPEGEEKSQPGYILSHNTTYFTQLFQLLDLDNDLISQKVWNLLLSIPTSKDLYANIYGLHSTNKLRSSDTHGLDDLFDLRRHFKLLYSLQIVDSILFPLGEKADLSDRAQWAEEFLDRGVFVHLLNILISQEGFKISVTLNQNPPAQEKNCLALILKIFDFFFHVLLAKTPEEARRDDLSAMIYPSVSVLLPDLQMDLQGLLDKLIRVVWAASTRFPDREDREIVTYATRLILLTVVYDPELFMHFVSREKIDQFLEDLLLRCPEPSMRASAAESFFQLCIKLENSGFGAQRPTVFFLKFLFSHLPSHTELDPTVWTRCRQFYQLLDRLICQSFDAQFKKNPGRTHQKYRRLLIKFIQQIRERPIVETRNSEAVDDLLAGLLALVCSLLKKVPKFRLEVGCVYKLVEELYHNCLFALKAGPGSNSPPKCKNKASRFAACMLLVELCTDTPENFLELLELLANHHTGALKINTWDYHPSSDDKGATGSGYVGLTNLGNTCYMNSLLQQFYMVPKLRNEFLQLPVDEKEDSLVFQLQNIFSYLQESEKQSYGPVGFCQAYKDWDGKPINVHVQQDVDEFFNLLCQRLEAQLKKFGREKLLSSVFIGQISNEIRSVDKEYPYVSESGEDFYTIPLDVKGKNHLHEALDAYVKGDKLMGDNAYYCEKYQKNVDAIKRCCIKKLSDTLILHLKRFEFDYTSYKKAKVNDRLEFPIYLNMKPWTKEGIAIKEGREVDPEDQHPDSYYMYELMGILVHSGNTEAGHYYSYIRERVPSRPGAERRWFEFNDKNVIPFDLSTMETECFGGIQVVNHWDNWQRQYVKRTYDRVRSAYMLVYDRIQPSATTPSSSLDQQQLTLINGVPAPLYKRIWEENAEFLRDRQLFDPVYFEFMLNFVRLSNFAPVKSDESTDPDDIGFRSIKLATHFLLEILTHSKESDIYHDFINQMKSLLSKHVPACKWFLLYFMNHGLLREYLLDCTIEKIRIGIVELLVVAMKTLAPHEYRYFEDVETIFQKKTIQGPVAMGSRTPSPAPDVMESVTRAKSIVVRLVDYVLALLEDSRNFWRRFKQYFMVIKEFAAMGWREREILFSRNLIALYADYFMGRPLKGQNRRVSIMDKFNLPDLTDFISTISILVRGCLNGAPQDKGLPPTLINDGVLKHLPESEKRELYDFTFLSSVLEMDYNPEATIEILLHTCWEDIKKSRWVLNVILSELSRNLYTEKLTIFLHFLQPVISLKDSYQTTRIVIALNPFSNSPQSKGIFNHIRDVKHSFPKVAVQLIQFVVNLANAQPPVMEYFSKHRRDLIEAEQYLETKMAVAGAGSDGEHSVDTIRHARSPSEEIMNGHADDVWKKDITYLVHQALKKLLASFGPQEISHDREMELLNQIESLKKENLKFKEALEYYRRHSPNVLPPPFMNTKEWELTVKSPWPESGKSSTADDAETDDESTDDFRSSRELDGITRSSSSGANPPSPTLTPHALSQRMQQPSLPIVNPNQSEELASIFGLSVSVATVALRRANNDMEIAASYLTDEHTLQDITREANLLQSDP